MDIIEHYIKSSSLVGIPTDFNELLNEASGGINKIDTLLTVDADGSKRKDTFIKIVDDAIAGKGKVYDHKGNAIQIKDPSMWPEMKKQLEKATSPSEIADWKGSINAKSEKNNTEKFHRLFGLPLGKFGKAVNGLSGPRGSVKSGVKKPTGADWEHLITHEWNEINNLTPDKDASEYASQFSEDYFSVANKIANALKGKISGSMTQFGGGKSSGNLTSFWKSHGGSDGTPKADMITPEYSISLKKKGGSQLMSAAKGETLATFHTAMDWWQGGSEGKKFVKGLINEVETKFEKITTHLSKTELSRLSKLPEDQWPENDRGSIEKFINVEKFHKDITTDIKNNLDPTTYKDFRKYFVYEAMSGQRKFGSTMPKARASVCVEFDGSSGGVTKFIPTTSNGKNNFSDPPSVSSEISSLASKASFYVSWKSSSGNPYSSWRVNIKESGLDNISSMDNILKDVIMEDKLVRQVNKKLLSENIQLDEWGLFKKAVSKFKGFMREKLGWIFDIYKKFLDKAKSTLKKIVKLGRQAYQGLLKFLGFEVDDVQENLPDVVDQFRF